MVHSFRIVCELSLEADATAEQLLKRVAEETQEPIECLQLCRLGSQESMVTSCGENESP